MVRYSILVFLLFLQNAIFAQKYPDSRADELLSSGIENIINQQYAQAEGKFRSLTGSYPELPLGNLYLAAVSIARSADYGEPFDDNYINSHLESASRISRKNLKEDEGNIWNIYCSSLITGFKAYYQALRENYLGAFSNGLSAISGFEDCLRKDSSFYEALGAIGTYKYWRSRKTGFLNWLPFIKDEREEGVRLLKQAVEHQTYNYYLLVNSLVWIYISNNQYSRAVNLSQKVLDRYPGSRYFRWGLARAYENIDKRKSIEVYREILESIYKLPGNNHLNEIILKHKMAMQYARLGEKSRAAALCDEILSIRGLSPFVKKELGNRLERVKNLRQELRGK